MYPPPPPPLFSEIIRNTLSALNTNTWSIFCQLLNVSVVDFLKVSAVTLTVTPTNAITSSGVTAHD